MKVKSLIILVLLVVGANSALAQTTEFTYQGRLVDGTLPANASYDFEFRLFDALANGTQLGSTQQKLGVSVANGAFTVPLDFGAQFPGTPRYVEIAVKNTPGPFTILSPRQKITSIPYAIRSLSAADALQLGGVAADQFVQTDDTRLSDARSPLPDSGNYIQNTLVQQGASNFNIGGNGTAAGTLSGNAVNSATQYNIGNVRVLSSQGTNNLFAGVGAGSVNTGIENSFFGSGAGNANTFGHSNSFFGRNAGAVNTAGNSNSFFGRLAGAANIAGTNNSFFGMGAGATTSTSNNSFFGSHAGHSITLSSNHSFFGSGAGEFNTTGPSNSFFGQRAGHANTTGGENSFFGRVAGVLNTTGARNSFFGYATGEANTTGDDNSFFGHGAGDLNTTGGSNSFFGVNAGRSNTTGSGNTAIGLGANVGSGNLTHATAIGSGAIVTTSDSVVLGRSADIVRVPGSFAAAGIATVSGNFTVLGTSNLIGLVDVATLGSAGGTDVCRNASNQLSTCSSSLRYKSGVLPFLGGLDIVRRLRPIAFNWNLGGARDVGFGAEEVQKVEPLLATYNDNGEIEGVKYKQITTVLVNAVNEQQAQIESLQERIEMQQKQIRVLTMLVCRRNKKADICMERPK